MEPSNPHSRYRVIIPDLLVFFGLVVLGLPLIGPAAMTLPRHVVLLLSAPAFASLLLVSAVIDKVPHPLLQWLLGAVTMLLIAFLALVAIRFNAWWELVLGVILYMAASLLALQRSAASRASRDTNNR